MKVGIVFDLNEKVFHFLDEERWEFLQIVMKPILDLVKDRERTKTLFCLRNFPGETLFSIDHFEAGKSSINHFEGVDLQILGICSLECTNDPEMIIEGFYKTAEYKIGEMTIQAEAKVS